MTLEDLLAKARSPDAERHDPGIFEPLCERWPRKA